MSEQDAGADIEVEPQRVRQWLDEQQPPELIDVREAYEREAGHIAGSRHVPLLALSEQAASFDASRPIVFYCRVGGRSEMAAQALRAAGLQAYSMSGGLLRWEHEGGPLSPEGGRVADH